MEPVNPVSIEDTTARTKELRVELDVIEKRIEQLRNELISTAAEEFAWLSLRELQSSRHWLGEALGALGNELPAQYADEAKAEVYETRPVEDSSPAESELSEVAESTQAEPETNEPEEGEKRDGNLRVVRTKLTGDKVYLLNEATRTKVWIRTPEQLKEHGFDFPDVQNIPDDELAGYKISL